LKRANPVLEFLLFFSLFMKECPFCSQKIQIDAKVCDYCKKDLPKKEKKSLSPQQKLWFYFGLPAIFLSLFVFKSIPILPFLVLFLFALLHPAKGEKISTKVKQYKWLIIFGSLPLIFLSFVAYDIQKEKTVSTVYDKQKEKVVVEDSIPQITITSDRGNQGEKTEYLLTFEVQGATIVEVNGKEVEIINGKGQQLLNLEDEITPVLIFAKNGQKENDEKFVITRNENEKEKEKRLVRHAEAEQMAKEAEVNNRKWLASKAGKICTKHPDWKRDDCEGLADEKIWIGMTYDMLVEMWGKPNYTNLSNYGYGVQRQWCWTYYTPSCFYDEDDDGTVDSYN
jgi:predicted nucleic acid-binding Zn ribbon protein